MTEGIFKILAICLIAAVLCVILKQKKSEYAVLVSVAAGIIIALYVINSLALVAGTIQSALEEYGVETAYFKVALKALGIGYITSFIADACKDAGQTSLALKAELAGKSAVFLLSLPLIISVLKTAVGFIK